jgi:predicted site-specific integrase-resolvase
MSNFKKYLAIVESKEDDSILDEIFNDLSRNSYETYGHNKHSIKDFKNVIEKSSEKDYMIIADIKSSLNGKKQKIKDLERILKEKENKYFLANLYK